MSSLQRRLQQHQAVSSTPTMGVISSNDTEGSDRKEDLLGVGTIINNPFYPAMAGGITNRYEERIPGAYAVPLDSNERSLSSLQRAMNRLSNASDANNIVPPTTTSNPRLKLLGNNNSAGRSIGGGKLQLSTSSSIPLKRSRNNHRNNNKYNRKKPSLSSNHSYTI